MKIGKLAGWFVLSAFLAGNGCATKTLWQKSVLDAYNEPDEPASLHLFAAGHTNDVLVVYKEYSERHDYSRARAYLLYKNQERLLEKRPPHFVSTNQLSGLVQVPLFVESSPPPLDRPTPPYALVSTNGQVFTLYSVDGATNSYDLPAYNDGRGIWWRIVLTPITVAADISIVGGVIGYVVLNGMAQSGTTVSP